MSRLSTRNASIGALFVTGAALIGSWLIFAKFVVPEIIEKAYRGEILFLLNRLIKGQAAHPLIYYLGLWSRVTVAVSLAAVGVWLVALIITAERKRGERLVPEATPGALGAIRMWTCVIVLIGITIEDLSSVASLPTTVRQHIGLMA